jgi:DNA-binding FadR family transcriptional regulator
MSTAVDTCFETLRRGILDGDYPPGARLPAERRLAEDLGVNRVTIRSALVRLAGANLLTVRQGSGYQVQDFRRAGGPDLLADIAAQAQRVGAFRGVARDLLLVRRHLASAVLERLAERPPTADDLTRISATIEAFALAVDEGADAEVLAARDLDIVASLLRATGSSVLGLCLNPITGVLQTLPGLKGAIYADPQSNVIGWRALLPWLANPSLAPVSAIVAAFVERDEQSLRVLAESEAGP